MAHEPDKLLPQSLGDMREGMATKEGAPRSEISDEKHLWERLRPLMERVAAAPKTSAKADKAFFDEMWGDE